MSGDRGWTYDVAMFVRNDPALVLLVFVLLVLVLIKVDKRTGR